MFYSFQHTKLYPSELLIHKYFIVFYLIYLIYITTFKLGLVSNFLSVFLRYGNNYFLNAYHIMQCLWSHLLVQIEDYFFACVYAFVMQIYMCVCV